MIKVIKPAQMQYRCTCPMCKAILEFREEDIDLEIGEYSEFEIIVCPECHNIIYQLDNWCTDLWEKIQCD